MANKVCDYCKKVRDDNEELIYDEITDEYVYITYKNNKFYLRSGICMRQINYCPMCGRKLGEE